MSPLRVLQITDTHLRPDTGATLLGIDTAESLCAVLDQALGEHTPELILATGDLAHDDATGVGYRRFLDLVRERYHGPILHTPGNHDFREPMLAAFDRQVVLRLGGWDVITFDTHEDGRVEASPETAEWRRLEGRLAASDAEHVLLACHHPPIDIGCAWLDRHRIPDGAALLELCRAHRVRGLVFGHVHQEVTERSGAVAVLGTPSTCFQFQPQSQAFAIDRSERTGRPGYRWLELHADGTLTSVVGRVEGHTLNIDLSDGS
jgi:3',5'-cyclic-AMP phosphodiesterase